MSVRVARESMYKDVFSIVLENDVLRVAVLPEFGSKIASIVYKPLSQEILWQNPGVEYRRSKYGDPYLEGECSGFDEMFPTISRCAYESYPWQGVEMPDHGEVWALPWTWDLKDDLLRMRVNGIRFPYALTKEMWLDGPTLAIGYTAENPSCFDFNYIWSAHPLFCAEEGMQIVVPDGMDRVVNSVPSEHLKDYGREYSFPSARLEDGRAFALDSVPARTGTGFQKYYFKGPMREGWCILYSSKTGINIGLRFPEDRVPYLGMFVNEGGICGHYEIAPEPATAAMDRVDASCLWGTQSILKARERAEWSLLISLSKGKKMGGIDAAGRFRS